MANDGLDVDTLRVRARASNERIVVRMQDELDKMIKLFSWAREATENEMTEGLGYKKLCVTDKDMKKLKELAAMCDSLVGAKIRFDKAAKSMADTMTQVEEKAAVVAYLKSCESQDRAEVISTIKAWEATRGNSDATS
jgi:hypothetical protein